MTEIVSKPDYGSAIGELDGKPVFLSEPHQTFFDDLELQFNALQQAFDAHVTAQQVQLPIYTIATLPSPSQQCGLVYVTDIPGAAQPVYSDGVNWRRVTNRLIVA